MEVKKWTYIRPRYYLRVYGIGFWIWFLGKNQMELRMGISMIAERHLQECGCLLRLKIEMPMVNILGTDSDI
ncbi:MAG: hypothetical protein IJZ55_00375 [Lachnospiraceae bacterium]|nr:hypothetical protein [Lachnospiraceae bacterium]